MSQRILLCIGTKKGLFVAESPRYRRGFALRGPFGPGVGVNAALIDTRGTPTLYASSCNPFFGMKVLRSTDLGHTFQETPSAPEFPKGDGRTLANIWSLEPGKSDGEIWCGVEPASLFRSRDQGDTWEIIPGALFRHHHRPALGRTGRWRRLGMPLRRPATHPLCQGRRVVKSRPLDSSGRTTTPGGPFRLLLVAINLGWLRPF